MNTPSVEILLKMDTVSFFIWTFVRIIAGQLFLTSGHRFLKKMYARSYIRDEFFCIDSYLFGTFIIVIFGRNEAWHASFWEVFSLAMRGL